MRYMILLLCFALLCGCASQSPQPSQSTQALPELFPETTEPSEPSIAETFLPDPIETLISSMTIEERVGQLFLARCSRTSAEADIGQYHLGGLLLFSEDFEGQTPDSLRQTLAGYQRTSRLPLLIAVDEEGGTVTRISRFSAFRDSKFLSPRAAFAQGGMSQALANEEEKCRLLASLNINVNLGPVCDLCTDISGFMYQRSLGQDAETTGEFVGKTVALMRDYGIGSVLKHFPGYGNNADTHTGIAVDSRPLEALEGADLLPFARGIHMGCGGVLVSHTIVEALDASLPASLSPAVHDYLRQEMGYEGVIITDDLVMQAITDRYGAEEAAVMAVLAGNDLLCSTEYAVQYPAVLKAVLEDRISLDALNQAVGRVLRWKLELGLISQQLQW